MHGHLTFGQQTLNPNKELIQRTMVNGRYMKPQEKTAAVVTSEWQPDVPAFPRSSRHGMHKNFKDSPVAGRDDLAWDEESIELVPRCKKDGHAI